MERVETAVPIKKLPNNDEQYKQIMANKPKMQDAFPKAREQAAANLLNFITGQSEGCSE